MTKKIFTLIIISYFFLSNNYNLCVTEDPGAGWWDFCLDNTVSYDLFRHWLGGTDAASRVAMRNYIKNKSYTSLLDIPCGLCIDYFGFKQDGMSIKYVGLDSSTKLVDKALKCGIDVAQGDIENINFPDNSFDVVYCRHILEHLNHYQKAVDEVIRVAKKEVLVVFFIKPTNSENDVIDLGLADGHLVYHNRYSKAKFSEYILSNPKVHSIEWEVVDAKEVIAHILLKI